MQARTLIDKVHRQVVIDACEKHDWNYEAAAKEIGICRTTLWAWRRRLKIERPQDYAAQAKDNADSALQD